MKKPFLKLRTMRLDPASYHQLQQQILERDGWRCQWCGRRDRLEIHHIIRRSQSGADSEENLIVLCSDCHRCVHSKVVLDSG